MEGAAVGLYLLGEPMLRNKITAILSKIAIKLLLFTRNTERINLFSEDMRKVALVFFGTGLVELLSDKVNHLTNIESLQLILLGLLIEITALAIFIAKDEQKESKS